jgi:hypothetical protein
MRHSIVACGVLVNEIVDPIIVRGKSEQQPTREPGAAHTGVYGGCCSLQYPL